MQDWVHYHQNRLHKIVLCLNMPEINYSRSDSWRVNQCWLLSPGEQNCLRASSGLSLCWLWKSQRCPATTYSKVDYKCVSLCSALMLYSFRGSSAGPHTFHKSCSAHTKTTHRVFGRALSSSIKRVITNSIWSAAYPIRHSGMWHPSPREIIYLIYFFWVSTNIHQTLSTCWKYSNGKIKQLVCLPWLILTF